MSHTDRNEKREPKERPFPYIPRGLKVVSTGHEYGEDDNMAYVRELLAAKQPEFHAALQVASQFG